MGLVISKLWTTKKGARRGFNKAKSKAITRQLGNIRFQTPGNLVSSTGVETKVTGEQSAGVKNPFGDQTGVEEG